MSAITSGVTAGGSLALAHHILSFASQPRLDPGFFCAAPEQGFCWRSYSLGIGTGILLYLLVEFAVTLKWALVRLVGAWTTTSNLEGPAGRKPLYRILS